MFIDSEGSPYPPPIQRYVRGRENSTNADALQPMLAPIRNNIIDPIDEDQFEQQPRRLQLPPPPAMQPDPNAANANANDNIVQIPRSMINVARRQQQLINADNLVSQDSNGSSGTGHEDSGPEHRLDRHIDEQPGPSSTSMHRAISPQAGPSSSNNNDTSNISEVQSNGSENPTAPYKLCILKDGICAKEVQENLKNIVTRTKVESIQYNRESGIVDRKRTEHDYARSKARIKSYSSSDRLTGSGRNGPSGNSTTRNRREERERSNLDRDNRTSRPNSQEQPRRRYLMREDDEEDNANAEDQDEDELDTSDCSLDESDFSSSV